MTIITEISLEELTTFASLIACCMYTGTIITCCIREGRLETASAFMDHEPILQILFFTVLSLTTVGSMANILSLEYAYRINLILVVVSSWCTMCAIFISMTQYYFAHMTFITIGSLMMYLLTLYTHSWRFAFLMTIDLIYLIAFYSNTDHFAVAEFIFFELVILRVFFNTIPNRTCEVQVIHYD